LTWRPSWDCCEVSKSFDEGGNLNHHQKEIKQTKAQKSVASMDCTPVVLGRLFGIAEWW